MRALEVLHSLAAIEDNGELTALGGLMASFPVDPQVCLGHSCTPCRALVLRPVKLAKFLIVSPQFSCSHEALSIVAMLSGGFLLAHTQAYPLTLLPVPNIWFHPRHERKEAEAAKAHLSIPDGDHLTLLNVYTNYVNSMVLPRTLLFSVSALSRSVGQGLAPA